MVDTSQPLASGSGSGVAHQLFSGLSNTTGEPVSSSGR